MDCNILFLYLINCQCIMASLVVKTLGINLSNKRMITRRDYVTDCLLKRTISISLHGYLIHSISATATYRYPGQDKIKIIEIIDIHAMSVSILAVRKSMSTDISGCFRFFFRGGSDKARFRSGKLSDKSRCFFQRRSMGQRLISAWFNER